MHVLIGVWCACYWILMTTMRERMGSCMITLQCVRTEIGAHLSLEQRAEKCWSSGRVATKYTHMTAIFETSLLGNCETCHIVMMPKTPNKLCGCTTGNPEVCIQREIIAISRLASHGCPLLVSIFKRTGHTVAGCLSVRAHSSVKAGSKINAFERPQRRSMNNIVGEFEYIWHSNESCQPQLIQWFMSDYSSDDTSWSADADDVLSCET